MCQSIWNIFLFLIGLQLCIISYVYAELTPPYFNLATGRKIYATATCGVGVDEPELYCKLVGANTENDNSFFSVIQGQVCDTCDPSHPDKHHPPEYAIDGTEAWWQSPPLSRGMKYNEVNLTIDFGQEFHVAYIFIRMANSPRPGLWTLEKSTDNGKTWTPWQHFSDTPADCEIYFGKNSLKPITKDDDVICTTEYSKIVPLENGEIPVMLLNNRPSANNYFNSTVLQEWTRATNVRIRLLRTKNLLGHLMSVARQDPTVTRRYFYSIKDISIGGRCMCNGHADTCDVLDPISPVRILACRCQHRTCGIQCNECCSGFVQKKWRQNTNARPFQCEPCNCFGHSNRCKYVEEIDDKGLSLDIHGNYEGGGVCQDCQHNTDGINCNKCKPKYYRPYGKYWNETDVCWPCDCEKFYSTGNCEEETGRCECRPEFQKPDCQSCAYGYYGFPNCRECDCNLNGTDGYHCEAVYGICPCKQNFAGPYCKQCADTYFNYPTCEPCNCDVLGSDTYSCDAVTGQCICRSNFGGIHCEMCKDGYYNHPNCTYCDCNVQGTLPGICDKNSGQCLCREGYLGPRCDRCIPGYYNFPDCIPCNCSSLGSISTSCGENDGKCNCLKNFAGRQCTQCSAGYYEYPKCLSCNCNSYGSEGVSCNSEGQCSCLSNFDGKLCDVCKEGFYNYPTCEECNCDPAGVIQKFAGCGSVPAGELCQCKERVTGRICDQCRPLYWNLSISNPDGCELCDCYLDGTISSLETCDIKSGQCTCKPSVQGRQCKECKDGSYELDGGSLFGCKGCDCDIGGSRHSVCDKLTGQCVCHQRITGRTCSRPLTTHYFPTLYQFQFEYEDGYTPSGAHVRYQYDESNFPGFSRKGYAVFSNIQNEVINEVNIFKSSVYRMVIRYHNPTGHNVTAGILITSDNPLELDQKAKVLFKPTHQPQFVTVSGVKGDKPSPIVLDPGRYTFGIKTDENILLDYFALLPAAYYEASILTKKIESPCQLDDLDLCRNYRYPSVEIYKPVFEPLSIIGSKIDNDLIEHYNDEDHMKIISHHGRIPILSPDTKSLKYPVIVPRTGRYVIVVDYVSHREHANIYYVNVRIANSPTQEDSDYGAVLLYPCLYSMVCRQPVIDDASREKLFFIDETNQFPIEIYDNDNDAHKIPIVSITAIPVEKWSVDFIKPSPVCVMQDSQCVPSTFRIVPSSKKIEIEIGHEARISHIRPPYAREDETLKTIYLSDRDPTLEIQSKASEPGRYVIIVQYYQSDNPKFQIPFRLTTEKQIYDGKFDVNHCPSSSGCRGLIRPESGSLWFDIDDEFNITFTNNRVQGLWLDYILLVPVEQYHDDLLEEETFDQTKEFIQQCGQDHFHIQLNASDFCRNAVFSLTADYNNGALQCNCDYEGSHSFECDPFGGQCQCKPNVIGRRCEACRTGYWGFPDCKHCDCPALCEKDTGRCICPLHVMGEKCDQCEPYTYGFHQLIGCEECNCNRLGVEGGNLQCDLNNGTCSCRPNIEGRACDQCSNGFYNFPLCDRCRCDLAGTTNEICDKADGNCFCKKNVVGVSCDRCIDGTYNLQKSNPDGCTQCFCFGKTTRCENAFMRVFNVSLINNVSINSVNISQDFISFEQWPHTRDKILTNDTTLQVHFMFEQYNGGLVYFGVLDHFASQNNHLTAYGGYLVYTLYYTSTSFGKPLYAPDIILHGKDIVLIHESYEQPSSSHNFKKSLKMVESNFLKIDKKPVSRAEFMMALRDLQMVYIRANYEEQTVLSQLSDVYLTLGAEDDENYREYKELSVERCHCPPGYTGLSCENCATGYYRIPDGLYGGYCVPCQCHGHTDTCDCNTGKCLNCMHYTTGDHCEKCIEGYHGNATYGTPYDCMICACPLPYDSNNFAIGCEISETGDEIHCECKPGYTGATCESCAAGFYGQPKVVGDYCKPCECSGNIDPNHPNSCDTITGDCLLCLNNTYGKACNLCAPGYYGDAVKLKDCKACDCDNLGLQYCDQSTGICNCLPNVIGERCDRCKPDYYGHVSGLGCKLCGCGLASNSTQCDDATGQCLCKPGVSGRQCDRCANDYWNYTVDGCIPCSCNKGFSRGFGCNTLTGQCECLPNVIGEKCDACPHRWVLEKDRGCFECDACHHALLNVTDDLHDLLNPFFEEFKHVARAHFTRLKLENYKSTANKLYPKIEALHRNQIDLSPQGFDVMQLEDDVKNLTKIISYGQQTAEDNSAKVNELLKGAIDVLNLTYSVSENARNTIKEVKNLAHSFDTSVTTKTENAKTEADTILSVISSEVIDVTPIEKQLQYSQMLTGEVEYFVSPAKQQSVKLESLMKNISLFEDKLNDLKNWSTLSLESSSTVNMLNRKNKEAFDAAKFDTVQNQTVEINRNNEETNKLVINGNITCDAINKNLEELKQVYDELKLINDHADKLLPEEDIKNQYLKDRIDNEAYPHSSNLTKLVDDLISDYLYIKQDSELAIKAVNAYSDIYNAVNQSRILTDEARKAVSNATISADGLREKVGNSVLNARDLLGRAKEAVNKVEDKLQQDLDNSVEAVEKITDLNNKTNDNLSNINTVLEQFSNIPEQSNLWNHAYEVATDALADAKKSSNLLTPIVKQINMDVEKSQNISKSVDNTDKDISQIRNHIERVIEVAPTLENLTKNLQYKQKIISSNGSLIGDQIEEIKRQIERARAIANSINFGVSFNETTTLELKTPETVPLLGTESKISLFFNTTNPNGFLMYLGNDKNKTNKYLKNNTDFVAIEIENGYPVLTIDLGNGPEKIINTKYVADGHWYHAIVDRTGNNVKFIIREQIGEGKDTRTKEYMQEKVLPGQFTVFNVDKNSRLFIGGYSAEFIPPNDVTKSSFQGEIEGLKIGDEEVGLWNFVDAYNNKQGAKRRNTFLIEDTQHTGYRFNGNGFVSINANSYNINKRCSIHFKFKASKEAPDGLMFYAGKYDHFIALEMNNGGIKFQYQMGQHLVTMKTELNRAFNDDEWHTVEAERDGRKGKLRVDQNLIYQEEAPLGAEEELRISEYIYFGGVPGKTNHSQIIDRNFDGCIKDVRISATNVDLSSHVKAYGIRPGCPNKFSTVISYPPNQHGYLKKANINANNNFQIHLKFKTRQSDGIIFYAANHDQTSSIGLTIHDGILVLTSARAELTSGSRTFNDGEEHIVTATHNDHFLRLTVDDSMNYTYPSVPPPLYISPGDIFFAGLPNDFSPPKGALSTLAYFSGCISAVTLNGQIVNFANTTDRKAGHLDSCSPDIFDYDISSVPIYYPGKELDIRIIPEESYKPSGVGRVPEHTTVPWIPREEITVTDAPPTIIARKTTTTIAPHHTRPQTQRPATKFPKQSKKTDGDCALPIDPEYDYEFSSGIRFGVRPQSRIEATISTKIHKKYDIVLEMKSDRSNGLLFYASDAQLVDFFALYIQNGQLYHVISCSSDKARLESSTVYDDNQWHKIHFSRNGTIARLYIDDNEEILGEPRCSKPMNIQTPLYFGSVSSASQSRNITQEVIHNLNLTDVIDYFGCIRNIQINGKQITSFSPHNVISCSEHVENGVFFGMDNKEDSYVKLLPSYFVGTQLTITFEMRPRVENGLIMSVAGNKYNYMILQLYNGSLYFNVMTSGQELEVKFSLTDNESFCDGQWRKVQAIKTLYVLTLAVNDISAAPAVGNSTKISTNTHRPLFLGGHQYLRKENRVPGIKVRKPYYGCIRNIKIGDVSQVVTPQMAHGDVWTGVCPLF